MTTARGVSGKAQQLRHRGTHQVAIDGGHALHTPVLGVTFNQTIDFGGTVGGDPEQIFGKALDVGAHVAALAPKGLAHLLRSLLSHVGLEKHLQRKFARFAAGSHREVVVSLRSSVVSLSLQDMARTRSLQSDSGFAFRLEVCAFGF